MEFHAIFHGSLIPPNEILLSSMEFHGFWYCHFIQCHATLYFHGIYHGIPWNSIEWPNKKSPSSMGFHGIRKAPLQMTQVFHGIPWNIKWNSMELWCRQMTYHLVPWNSMELWCSQMKYHLVPWNSMELWDCHFIQCHATLDFHEIYHGFPWNSIKWPNKKNHLVPWVSMVLGGRLYKWHRCSVEFHGTLVPPNTYH